MIERSAQELSNARVLELLKHAGAQAAGNKKQVITPISQSEFYKLISELTWHRGLTDRWGMTPDELREDDKRWGFPSGAAERVESSQLFVD